MTIRFHKYAGVVTVLFALLFCCVLFSVLTVDAFAATSGTSGTCSWVIDDDGVLTISPTDGVSGQLISYTSTSGNGPWYDYRTSIKKVVVEPGVKAGVGCYKLFHNLTACTEMDLSNLDTSDVTNMSYMFYGCSKLTSLDLSSFDTSKVTNMGYMFRGCSRLTSLDLSSFNTSKVTRMDNMFQNCSKLTSLDASSFDTSKITTMSSMFDGCSGLTSLDVSSFDTGDVKDMGSMFENCSGLTSLDVSGFDTSSVTTMYQMFSGCSGMITLGLSSFNTSNVTSMEKMFNECSSLTSLDISSFDTGNVKKMNSMFTGCSGLTSLDVSLFDTSKVTAMNSMFNGCSGLTSLDLSSFNTSNVKNMNHMFRDCSKLTSLDVSLFDTNNVTKMAGMFYNCSSLTSLDVSSFDTSNVIGTGDMFSGCSSLTLLDVSSFDTSNVTDMGSMFYNCSSLTSLDVSSFDTSRVTDMGSMFNKCSGLTSLGLSSFNTGSVTTMSNMFCDCSGLTSLDISGFDTSKVTSMANMFLRCTGLTSLDVSSFDTSNVTYIRSMFSGCSSLASLDLSSFNTSNVTNMGVMFNGCSSLSSIGLGQAFSFKGKNITSTTNQTTLPTPPSSTTTGKWIRDDEAVGPYTAEELRDNYGDNATAWAGTWVWQEIPTKYTFVFYPGDANGEMANQKILAVEDGTINPCTFTWFNHHFDHWDASDGNTYADGATIPANTYTVGTTITLTAVFVENDNRVNIDDGEFEITLHGGEEATLSALPAGTYYQVYEETPDGWVLVEQSNTSGAIQPLETSNAEFTNKYQPGTATVQLSGTKTLDNRPAEDGAFSFELLEGNEVLQTVTIQDGGFIQFGILEYTSADIGTHTYKIREVDPEDESIDYDTHVETVSVVVTDDGAGNVHAEVTYDADGIVFANTTRPGTMSITKQTEGSTDTDTEFTFKITLTNENGMPISDGDTIYWYSENDSQAERMMRQAQVQAVNAWDSFTDMVGSWFSSEDTSE